MQNKTEQKIEKKKRIKKYYNERKLRALELRADEIKTTQSLLASRVSRTLDRNKGMLQEPDPKPTMREPNQVPESAPPTIKATLDATLAVI